MDIYVSFNCCHNYLVEIIHIGIGYIYICIYIIKLLNSYTVMKACGLVVEKDIHFSHLTLIYKHFWIDNIGNIWLRSIFCAKAKK